MGLWVQEMNALTEPSATHACSLLLATTVACPSARRRQHRMITTRAGNAAKMRPCSRAEMAGAIKEMTAEGRRSMCIVQLSDSRPSDLNCSGN